jgi:spermidine/putrescine transport system permease protein
MTTLAQALPRRRSLGLAWIRRYVLTVYAGLALVYLFLPIAIVILFSFNNPAGRFNYTWQGFTFKNWTHPLNYPGLQGALTVSIEIALLSSLVATALGTLIALALVRHRFWGRGLTNLLIFLPMTTPEVVMGASLLTLFTNWRYPTLGFATILIAHIMFNISYVVVTVKARVAGFDRRLEEAAMDLGANELVTFWKVTFPLIFPGIMAAALLAFSLSIDDFVITNFVSGTTNTFPIWVYGIIRNALPAQINVIGSIIFLTAVAFVAITTIRTGRVPR